MKAGLSGVSDLGALDGWWVEGLAEGVLARCAHACRLEVEARTCGA